ncbi:hypothetical protein MMUC44124_20780 [Mycolicibacterium mucogenicum DSM 44124]|nr:hypothetical protein MMUC44124_20780 [Mycolicibacterium mucogenicum DSM 44124]
MHGHVTDKHMHCGAFGFERALRVKEQLAATMGWLQVAQIMVMAESCR